ncbi:hypothetical protein PFISCL1PPCAC_7258, partial [Pristionchus fissidentatus]
DNIAKAMREVENMAKMKHCGIVGYNSTWKEEPPEGWQIIFIKYIRSRIWAVAFSSTYKCKYGITPFFLYMYTYQLCDSSLAKWLAENHQPRDLSKMKAWFKQLVEATAHMHDRRVLHRDIKPSNILFDGADILKLCDLGLSTDINLVDGEEKSKSRTNQVGTPRYMSPEQVGNITYTSQVDVFALGLILAELAVPLTKEQRTQVSYAYIGG